MRDLRELAHDLLAEFSLVNQSRPKHNAIEVQIEKDACGKWANHLSRQLHWGTDNDIAEACYQLKNRLEPLKEKVILEILKHGTV